MIYVILFLYFWGVVIITAIRIKPILEQKRAAKQRLEEKQRLMIEKELKKEEKKAQVIYDIDDELNNLYFQRDLLIELSNKLALNNYEGLSVKELKTAIGTEKALGNINKKINTLETKKRFL